MKLRRVTIENYKALGYVDVHFRRNLLFLIGVNGAGKSSLLQALSFVRYFNKGVPGDFFKDRGWKSTDARPKTTNVTPLRAATTPDGARRPMGRNLAISLALKHDDQDLLWSFRWSYGNERTIEESVWVLDRGSDTPRCLFSFPIGRDAEDRFSYLLKAVRLDLPGSVLALIRPEGIVSSDQDAVLLQNLKAWADGIASLELLNPTTMRNRLRNDGPDIGSHGEHLASFLAALSADAKDSIVRRMADFYPINDIDTTRKRTGWIDMKVAEAFKLMGRVDLAHMSDGFLRILALCSIPDFGEAIRLVLLDEVEDGIEPHILPHLIERVAADSSAQLVMTSHSPLLINFFEQDEIYLLARDSSGHTVGGEVARLRPFQQGGNYFGTGEIWANAGLESLDASMPHFRPPRRRISEEPSPQEVIQYLRS